MHAHNSTTYAPLVPSKQTLIESAKTLLLVLLLVAAARSTAQSFRVDGHSMEQRLHTNQYVLINKLAFLHFDANIFVRWLPGNHALPARVVYPFGAPQRGDIVVFDPPEATYGGHQEYIKRIVGLPGETIQIKNGYVYINGVRLIEPYISEPTTCIGANEVNGGLCVPYVIPPGMVVVLGDHRGQSVDSRSWHAQPSLALNHVVGKAWISVWSYPEWGVLSSPFYTTGQE